MNEIEKFAESYGELYVGYSGRGMFGRTCLGVVIPREKFYEAKAEAIKSPSLRGFCTDSMGLDYILYWPEVSG